MSDSNYGLSWPQETIDYLMINYAGQSPRVAAAHLKITTRELARGIYNIRKSGTEIPFLDKTVRYTTRNMPKNYRVVSKPAPTKAVKEKLPAKSKYKEPYQDNENSFLGRPPVNKEKKIHVRHHFDEETMVRVPHPLSGINPKYRGAMIEVKR